MNFIFACIFTLAVVSLCFSQPEIVLSTMLSGGEKALSLTLKLTVIYAVWLGAFEIFDKTGITKKFARLLQPINKLLFGNLTDKENEYVSLNVSANMLGMSGATTPMGIKAIEEFEKRNGTTYQIIMFFVINATSLQFIPSSVMALRTSLGSTNASDVILPTILTTFVSCVIGILLVKIFVKKDKL
jgi:spore maturation protein A